MEHPPLPNLLVIGAMKCGTSSLHRYLDLHPEVAMSRPKELNFFLEEADRHYVSRANWHRGVEWYSRHFAVDAPVRGESSPNYTAYPHLRGIPQRAAGVVPDATLIYMVRDPIERIVSQYLHRVASGREARSLDETLGDVKVGPGMGYVNRSRYFMQVERWLEHFPEERLLVVAQEDLLSDRVGTLRRVFRFLGVDASFDAEEFATEYRQRAADKRAPGVFARRIEPPLVKTTRRLPERLRKPARKQVRQALSRRIERPVVSPGRRRLLAELLRDDVERLRALTGQSFDAWSL